MNGRFWISVVVLFVLSMMSGFLIHGMLLHGDYQKLPNLMRTEEEQQQYFIWMMLGHALMAIGLTWIYRMGRDADKPFLGQGLRFGVAIAILMTIPIYLIYYAVQPWPGAVVVKQIVYDVIHMLILGVAAAAINQGPKRT